VVAGEGKCGAGHEFSDEWLGRVNGEEESEKKE
jgi:hypothetical protein